MADPTAVTMELPPRPDAPDPARIGGHLTPADGLRLMLHAELTRAAVPPHPDDLRVIHDLAQLDGDAVGTIVRWLRQAAGSTVTLPPRTVSRAARTVPAPAQPPAPEPATRVDPRLLAW
ncbi:hypothetical protein ACFYYR_15540 [Streptomyces sp. NPDC001922]|uniref:hypothetical protein n=1 Tax=Streptomyces sp. NPDC001922 TaxID=3364624 RepID=UPI0036B49D83